MLVDDSLLLELKEAAEETLTIHLVPDFLKSPKYRIFVHTRRPSIPDLTGVDGISDMSIQRDSKSQYDLPEDIFIHDALAETEDSSSKCLSTKPEHCEREKSFLRSISECPTLQSSWSDEDGPLNRSTSSSDASSSGESSRVSEPERERCSGLLLDTNADSSSSSGQGSDSSDCDESSSYRESSSVDSLDFNDGIMDDDVRSSAVKKITEMANIAVRMAQTTAVIVVLSIFVTYIIER